jgi:hypothetical protein
MSDLKRTVFCLLIEIVIYAALVFVYLALVLHFLGGWLKELSTKDPPVYAVAAILLMIAQAVGLERLVSGLAQVARGRG